MEKSSVVAMEMALKFAAETNIGHEDVLATACEFRTFLTEGDKFEERTTALELALKFASGAEFQSHQILTIAEDFRVFLNGQTQAATLFQPTPTAWPALSLDRDEDTFGQLPQ